MKALLKTRPGPGLVLSDIPIPKPKHDELLVKVRAASLCGSDLNCYYWNEWAAQIHKKIPFVLGHEYAGDVIAVGTSVTGFLVGDQVAGETHVPCGSCLYCREGNSHICKNMEIFGHTMDGCFAEYCIVPERAARKFPQQLTWEQAALLEPMGVSVRAVADARVQGRTVLLLGCGSIGLFALLAAKAMEAAKVFGVELIDSRARRATELGMHRVFHPEHDDFVQEILAETGGYGVDVVIECSGSEDLFQRSFRCLRKRGQTQVVGLLKHPVPLNFIPDIIFKEATLRGFHGRTMFETWDLAESFLKSGKVDVNPLITHRLKLEDYKIAFDLLRVGNACKIVMTP
jgi:threonine 3-dehydrogenase